MQTCESNLHRVALHDLLEEHTSLGVHGIRMGRNFYEWMFFMNKSRPPLSRTAPCTKLLHLPAGKRATLC